MTLINLLVLLLVIVVVGVAAYWIINKFFPEPMRMIALAVVGVVLLIVLLYAFVPGLGNVRIG